MSDDNLRALIKSKYNENIDGVDCVSMHHIQLVINTVREFDNTGPIRKVVVYEWRRAKKKSTDLKAPPLKKVSVGNGLFHRFGVNYEGFDDGVGNYTTAIVEMPDGSVMSVPVDMIVFNN
jgi:hypothetical protein